MPHIASQTVYEPPLGLGQTQQKPGMTPATNILTLDGALPIEWIEAGDRVITRDRGMAVVTHVTSWAYHGALVLIRKDALGPDRPAADLRLVPSQILRLRNPDDERRPLKATALDLTEEEGVELVQPEGPVQLYDLWFDHPHIIYAEGLELLVGLTE